MAQASVLGALTPRPAEAAAAAVARVGILGVGVSALHMREALDRSEALLEGGGRGYVCVTGVHGIMEAQRDERLRAILNGSFLTVPDGMPTVWVGKAYGHASMDRVYGPDYMLGLCERSVEKGYRHFFYGGQQGVADDLRAALQERFPGLIVAGTYTPPFRALTEAEGAALGEQIREAEVDVLWVGLSTPKQERWMAEWLPRLDAKLMVGVGAAFDIHTGRIQDAPAWMKRSGLQWLHRLVQEPRRLARRYLINNPIFAARVGAQLLGDRLRKA